MKLRIPKIAAFAAAAMIATSIMTPATIAIAAEPTVEAILTKSANGISNDTIKLERAKALIEIGESADINIVYGPTDVVWTSDDVSIVSVTQGGVITGISAGCAYCYCYSPIWSNCNMYGHSC